VSGASERYGARVWREFKANSPALWSLRTVIALAFLALTADFLANDKPYYMEYQGESY
jgi:ABC-type microcin C transport system permease subunit YejE